MKKDSDKNIDYLVEFASLIENEKDCNRMLKALDRVKSGNKYIIDKANQSKTEFAIQELEKVKSSLFSKAIQITGTGVDCVRLYEINKIINQQIKELSNNTFKCEICGEITPKNCEGGEPNVCADCVPVETHDLRLHIEPQSHENDFLD